jgi:hypothetical protein
MDPDLDLDVAICHDNQDLAVFESKVSKFIAKMVISFFGMQNIGVKVKIVALVQQPSPGHDLGFVQKSSGGFHDRSVAPQIAGDLVDVLVLAPGFSFALVAVCLVAALIVAVFFIGPSGEFLVAVFAPVVIYINDGSHKLVGNQWYIRYINV